MENIAKKNNSFKCINTEVFNSIELKFYILNDCAYKIEWHSKMTGATAVFATFNNDEYVVTRNWSQSKNLENFDLIFSDNRAAFKHFLLNVDVIKVDPYVINRAKKCTTDFFTEREGLDEITNPKFFYSRLQSSIGMRVNIYDQSTKDNLIAKGYLLQLIGGKAQVQISERLDLRARKPIQIFPTKQVALV